MRDLDIGVGLLHLDVLGARLRRQRQRVMWVLCSTLLIGIGWHSHTLLAQRLWGTGVLTIVSPPHEELLLDDVPVTAGPLRLTAGTYRVTARQPGWYPASATVTVTRDHTTTYPVPPLRPRPTVHVVPLPAPGMHWAAVGSAPAGGWILTASGEFPAGESSAPSARGTPVPALQTRTLVRSNIMHLRPGTADANTISDEVVSNGTHWWASYAATLRGLQATGLLTIHTPTATQTLTPTAPLRGLWWSPDGTALLIAAMSTTTGTTLICWRPGHSALDPPIVTLRGVVESISWHPDGRAAVIVSRQGTGPPDATVLTGVGTDQPQAQALPVDLDDVVVLRPFAWSRDALYWIAHDSAAHAVLRVPLDGTLPMTIGTLGTPAVALHVVEAQLWVLAKTPAGLALHAWPNGPTVLTIDDVPATASAAGLWDGQTLLLMEDPLHIWTLSFASAALPSHWCSSDCSAAP